MLLPTRITDTTATLIDNIFTNNVDCRIASGLVMMDIADHLLVYAFVWEEEEGCLGQRRMVNQESVRAIAWKLTKWGCRTLRSVSGDEKAAHFENGLRELYYESFPEANCRKGRRDVEKPWVDNPDFMQLVEKKKGLYYRKLWRQLMEEGARLREVRGGGQQGKA